MSTSPGSALAGRWRAAHRLLTALLFAPLAGGCLHARGSSRDLRVDEGRLVSSPAPPPQAYAAYLRARLALERGDADLTSAARAMEEALALAPDDGHLWATQAELLHRMGDEPGARASLARAQRLCPDDPKVRALARTWAASGATAGRRQP